MSGLLLLLAFSVFFPLLAGVLIALFVATVTGMLAGTVVLLSEIVLYAITVLAPAGARRIATGARRVLLSGRRAPGAG